MTGKTRITIVLIAVDFIMVVVYLILIIVFVAINTTENRIIIWINMAFNALIPFIVMCTAIYRKVHAIVIKSRRLPGRLGMTCGTIRWKLSGLMIRIRGAVVVRCMATETSIWCVCVISVVTNYTIVCYSSMGSDQWIKIVVIKRGRSPGTLCMT